MIRKVAITNLSDWHAEDCEIVRSYKRNNIRVRSNGYSIAEILLVFGIIAGVLTGVWAMYTMLSRDSSVGAAVADIRLMQQAMRQYMMNNNNQYSAITFGALTPYLGDGIKPDPRSPKFRGVNTFGDVVLVHAIGGRPENALLLYNGIPDLEMCGQILKHFGTVEATISKGIIGRPDTQAYIIRPGHTIVGFIGGDRVTASGCKMTSVMTFASLSLTVD